VRWTAQAWTCHYRVLWANLMRLSHVQVCAAVAAKVDWAAEAKDLDSKSPLEAMDHVRLLTDACQRSAALICLSRESAH
jgi:hypothetical protein